MMKSFMMPCIFLLFSSMAYCQEYQSKQLVGGFCEGCETVFEFEDKKLTPVDTLIDFDQPGRFIIPTARRRPKMWYSIFITPPKKASIRGVVMNPVGRAGTGLVQLKQKNGLLIGARDVILGKNVPHYD